MSISYLNLKFVFSKPTNNNIRFLFLYMQNQRSGSQTREARPPPRFSKKVFQNNCNVAAAGDPRAKLGSYTQAYGTINKTELDNLVRSCPHKQ